MRRQTIRLAVLALALAASLGAFIVLRGPALPPEWSPWAPLDLDAAPNLLTRYKLARLSDDAELCADALAQAAMTYRGLPDEVTGPECGLFDAVTIERTASDVGEPFSLTCRAAVSLALWEKYAVAPAAEQHFASPVQRIEHFGSYACRNVYGRAAGTRLPRRSTSRASCSPTADVSVCSATGTRTPPARDSCVTSATARADSSTAC